MLLARLIIPVMFVRFIVSGFVSAGGGVVSLSPAAPSYNLYKDYEGKSKAFIDVVVKNTM